MIVHLDDLHNLKPWLTFSEGVACYPEPASHFDRMRLCTKKGLDLSKARAERP